MMVMKSNDNDDNATDVSLVNVLSNKGTLIISDTANGNTSVSSLLLHILLSVVIVTVLWNSNTTTISINNIIINTLSIKKNFN